MRLFGKKKEQDAKETHEKNEEEIIEKNEEDTLKEELKTEVENLQDEFRKKQEEIKEIKEKIETVKEEYDSTVSSLMLVKKELNQKKMELDVSQRKYNEIRNKIKDSEQIKNSKAIEDFKKTKENLSAIKQELEEKTKEVKEIKEKITQEQSSLHSIKKQQIEIEKELDEANSRLYNAKEELNKKDQFQDTNILTPNEKEFIQGDKTDEKNSAGIIEAASAVVGSLKSKLNMTQKELEAVQLLLEKEREEHEETRKKLKKFQTSTK